tara:strand:+ start:445 stop:657 length:213 start_codon:yes stop_codon:yes gene_type:complete
MKKSELKQLIREELLREAKDPHHVFKEMQKALQKCIIELDYAQQQLGPDRSFPRKNAINHAKKALQLSKG